MPLALLAAMPPIIAASIEAGSGPILLPSGASLRLAAAPITPGCSVINAPSAATSMPRQPSPSMTRTESLIAWPERLVPAARNVTGVVQASAAGEHAAELGLVVDHDEELGDQAVEAGVGSPSEQAQRVDDEALGRQEAR